MDPDELRSRFEFRAPANTDTVSAHERVRADTRQAALALNAFLPESREKSLALTALQEAMMWGNAAIAIHGLQS